jgi:hypothetical protein
MNSMDQATSPAIAAPDTRGMTFWAINSAVWAAYAGALMIPWIGTYPVLDMMPNKIAIAASGLAVSGLLRAWYRWMDRRATSRLLFAVIAGVSCLVAAIILDATIIALTQGPGAVAGRWDGSLGNIVGGVPMPGRVGQYATLLMAWSLGLYLFNQQRRPAAGPRATSPEMGSDAALSVAGATVQARDGGRLVLLDRDEIDWIAADGDYVRVHAGPRNLLIRATMKQTASVLAPLGFVRVHRSAIVNPRRVREVVREGGGEHSVVLRQGTRIKAGRNYAAQLDGMLRVALSATKPGEQ